MQRSNTLETNDISDIGLWLQTSWKGLFFGIGLILDSFHSNGSFPQDKLLLKSSHKDGLMLAAQVFSNTAGILSGPVALSTSRVLSTQQTSPSANSRSEMVI
jgi:hypothetical protein